MIAIGICGSIRVASARLSARREPLLAMLLRGLREKKQVRYCWLLLVKVMQMESPVWKAIFGVVLVGYRWDSNAGGRSRRRSGVPHSCIAKDSRQSWAARG